MDSAGADFGSRGFVTRAVEDPEDAWRESFSEAHMRFNYYNTLTGEVATGKHLSEEYGNFNASTGEMRWNITDQLDVAPNDVLQDLWEVKFREEENLFYYYSVEDGGRVDEVCSATPDIHSTDAAGVVWRLLRARAEITALVRTGETPVFDASRRNVLGVLVGNDAYYEHQGDVTFWQPNVAIQLEH